MGRAGDASPEPPIEFRRVTFGFDDLIVLRNISFSLRVGEMLVLTGDSGSGKSVLLHLAMGLLRPDSGQILIHGADITKLKEPQIVGIRGRSMGMMFQGNALFTSMSVHDNVAYRPREQGWSDLEIDDAVAEILRFVGLEDASDKYPDELSGGMKRRLEFARAIVGWPSIMLYDEPTSNLDPINARHILDLMITARDFHRTSAICVTKELHEIAYLTTRAGLVDLTGALASRQADPGRRPDTRLMILQNGSIAFLGDPAELATSTLPAIVHLTHPEQERLQAEGVG